MLSVSIIIPAWNESERIATCILNAVRQSVPAHEIIVVDNNSTDNTREIVEECQHRYPESNIILLEQNAEQGLIPTRNYGLNHATGDILGRIDADTMLKPDWVEVVSELFTVDPKAMGATGPVAYYDMPGRKVGLWSDNSIRKRVFRADGNQSLLFGTNMALRATAWKTIRNEVCRDREDIMHEDIDISLHMLENNLKTVYSPNMIAGMSARRMDTSFSSFKHYMNRFKNTFNAHSEHTRKRKPEHIFLAMYPALHIAFPLYQKYLDRMDINPAQRVWMKEQMKIAQSDLEAYGNWITDAETSDSHQYDDQD